MRQTRMAAAIAKSPRSAADRTATHHRIGALRELINYWLGWRKFPSVRAGCSLRSKGEAPAGFAAIAIGPLPDAVPQRSLTEGDGWISPLPRTGQRPRRGAR